MSSPELVFNQRYRVIYAVDERPGSRVLRCRDDQSGRLVLVAELPAADAEARESVELLAKQITTVSSNMLLPLTDHFAEGESYYLVCDDPGGQDLERLLRTRGGPLPEAEALREAGRLLELVEHLHDQRPQLLLGEPMPGDVLVAESGAWAVTPFTLARPIGQGPSPYRAPELAQADAEPTRVSDLYAAAALLYHALTGWAPPSAEQQQAGMPLNGPRVLNPQISQLAEQALLRGLQLKPLNRYQTAREMRIALETVQMLGGRSLGLGPDVLSGSEMLPSNMGAEAQGRPTLHMPPPSTSATQTLPPAQPAPAPPPQYPPQGYAPGQAYQPGAPPYYPPQPQKRGGISTGCLIGIAVLLALMALSICVALALLLPGGPLRGLVGLAPMAAAPTSAPAESAATPAPAVPDTTADPGSTAAATQAPPAAALAPGAITATNAETITQTAELTGTVLGPAAYAPNGASLAVGVSSGVALLDAETLESRAQLGAHSGRVTSLAWSADSSLLASGASGDDARVIVWDAAAGAQRHVLTGHTGWIRSLAFSPTGATLASGSTDQTIILWDAQSGQQLRTLTGHTSMIGGLAFSPDGAQLVSGSRDGTVRLWDVATGQEVAGFSFRTPTDPTTTARYWTTGISFTPDGARIAVGATNGVVYVLDAKTGDELRQLQGHTNWIVIRGVSFGPDGTLYTGSLDGTVRAWDLDSGQQTAAFNGHSLDVFAIAVSGDGARLVSVSDQEGRVIIWDAATASPVDTLRVGQGVVTSMAFSPDSAVLGSVGYNGVIQLRLLADGRSRSLAGSVSASQALAFLNEGRLAAITDEASVVLIDVAAENTAQLSGLSSAPASVAASANGSLLASGTLSGTVTLWDGRTGEVAGELRGSLPVGALLAFSSDAGLLAVGGPPNDPRIEVWDLARREVLHTIVGAEAPIGTLAFQPGGALLAAADLNGALTLYDSASGAQIRTIQSSPENGWFAGMGFSPDGGLLATGTPTGLIQLWNPVTGAEIARLEQDFGVVSLAFSPDGTRLAVSGRDASVRLYEAP